MRAQAGEPPEGRNTPPPGLPDLPISPHANRVTARGLAQLHARADDARRRLDETDAADTLGRAYLARHLRWLEARIASAEPVAPPPQEHRDRAGFGAWVEIRDATGKRERLRIVGEDEADAEHGLVSWVSPLARALEGARAGERVRWRLADGEVEAELLEVAYEGEPGSRH